MSAAPTTPRQRVFTGTRPTGPWHLGHMWGVLGNMVRLQANYDCFYCIVDYHALTTAWAHPERIQSNIREIALDWMAGGIDPMQSTMFVQSHVPEVAEFATLLNMITPTSWLERNPTYKETLEQNKAAEANAGLFTYPVLQTADICLYKGELVPIGKDQAAHLHLSQDIAKTFLHTFKREVFPVPDYLFAEMPLIPGIDNRKMSKSYGNAIDMKESPDSTQEKVMRMFTDPQKQRKGDPGHPDDCPVFTFHRVVSTAAEVAEVRTGCEFGALGCVDCKKHMGTNLVEHLAPMRERRKALEGYPGKVDELLAFGAEKARKVAGETMREVRQVMGLERGFYLNDGGMALPPSLQFNEQDPEFQGGYHSYCVLVKEADRAKLRAHLIGLSEAKRFKFHGFEEIPGGELVILASSNKDLKLEGIPLLPYGTGYELSASIPPRKLNREDLNKISDEIIATNPKKIYAASLRPSPEGKILFRVHGKSLSPSDQRQVVFRIAKMLDVPPESLELTPNDHILAGPPSIAPPRPIKAAPPPVDDTPDG